MLAYNFSTPTEKNQHFFRFSKKKGAAPTQKREKRVLGDRRLPNWEDRLDKSGEEENRSMIPLNKKKKASSNFADMERKSHVSSRVKSN